MSEHPMRTDQALRALALDLAARVPSVGNRVERLQRKLVGFDLFYGVVPYWPSAYLRDDPCAYCGRYKPRMQWEHLDARYDGHGKKANLARACSTCNQIKNRRSVLRYLRDKAERYWKIPLVSEPS